MAKTGPVEGGGGLGSSPACRAALVPTPSGLGPLRGNQVLQEPIKPCFPGPLWPLLPGPVGGLPLQSSGSGKF